MDSTRDSYCVDPNRMEISKCGILVRAKLADKWGNWDIVILIGRVSIVSCGHVAV